MKHRKVIQAITMPITKLGLKLLTLKILKYMTKSHAQNQNIENETTDKSAIYRTEVA